MRPITLTTALCAALLLGWSVAAIAASLTGSVRFDGRPVPDAVVYFADAPAAAGGKPAVQTIEQREMRFRPKVSVVPAGATVRFENNDTEMHNVISDDPQNRFDVGARMPGMTAQVVFSHPGVVRLRCKIHPEMRATVFVAPSAGFARTGADGRYRIDSVPPGPQRVAVWHERLSAAEVAASARAVDDQERIDFDLRPEAPAGSTAELAPARDWRPVVGEIRVALTEAVERWTHGAKTSALIKAMTAHSALYHESGLSLSLAHQFGAERADDYDRRFQELIRALQATDRPSAAQQEQWRRQSRALVEELERAATEISPASNP